MSGETGVDEPRGGVSKEPEPPQARLPFEPARDVIGEGDRLVGRAENELAGMQDERLTGRCLDHAGELVLLLGRIDVRIPMILEDAEVAVEANIDAGRLNHGRVIGVDDKPAVVDRGLQITVAQQHAWRLSSASLARSRARAGVVQWQNISFPS